MNEAPRERLSPAEAPLAAGSLIYTPAALAATCGWLLLGALAWNLKDRAAQPIVQLLVGNYGASDNYSSNLVGTIPAVLAMFFLPFIGCLSDRFRSAWGRRIPFLAMTLPFVILSMVGLAASPWLGTQLHLLFGTDESSNASAVVTCLTGFWGIFAFADILGTSIFGALINDVIPERIMGRFFGAFRAVALIAGIVFNYGLFRQAETHYDLILLAFGALTVLAVGLLCLKVREGSYPPAPPDPVGLVGFSRETKMYFQETFGSRFYVLLFIAWAIGSTAWNPINYYSVRFASGYISSSDYSSLLTVTFIISLALAYPIGVFADRLHPLRLAIGALALYAVAMLWSGLFAKTPMTFEIAFVLHGVLSGTYMTATASLLQRLLPRLKFAQFATTAGACVCAWNILIVPLAGVLLDAMNHDCHSIFLLSFVLSGLGLIVTVFLYRAYLAQGGDRSYVAPRS